MKFMKLVSCSSWCCSQTFLLSLSLSHTHTQRCKYIQLYSKNVLNGHKQLKILSVNQFFSYAHVYKSQQGLNSYLQQQQQQ